LRNAVMNEIFAFAGSQPQVDDITLMIIKHLR
jgi:serine phosphatase RsbU (regulator of sigma subunit)